MELQKRVLLIGLEPNVVDYSKWPGLTAEKVFAGIENDRKQLNELGYQAETCFIDLGETAIAKVTEVLNTTQYDCVMIGAGVRKDDVQFILFEQLINVIHQYAPQAKICFNTKPSDTAAAVQRWI